MANVISFSPDQARGVATSISRKSSEADRLVKQLQKEIHAVSGWWQGESQKAFVDQFDGLMPSFNEMVKCVDEISKSLLKIAEIKQDAEAQMAKQLRGR